MPGCMEDFCNNNYDNKCTDCGKKLCNEHGRYVDGLFYCSECVPRCEKEDCNNVGTHVCEDCRKRICDEHSFEDGFDWYCLECKPEYQICNYSECD